jgi:hypothetical protein
MMTSLQVWGQVTVISDLVVCEARSRRRLVIGAITGVQKLLKELLLPVQLGKMTSVPQIIT